MKLHASGEDYLEAILVLHKKMGMVRSVDVARHMEVSKPSVCHAVASLRDGGFLTMDEDHFLHLTDVGCEVAEKIYERHCFFTEQLITAGVDPKTAEADALFIIPLLKKQLQKLNWGGNGATLGRLERMKIMLPINTEGDPDYKYMEQYIKNIMIKKYKAYLEYADK